MPVAHLAPSPRPVGIFDQFIARETTTLVLKEKVLSLTQDSFDIKMANGQPIFRVKGRKMTISGRKSVYDMADNHLFDIVKEHLHIHTTYAAEDPSGKKIMEVKSSFKLIGSKATATFTSNGGQVEELVMEGNWLDTKADIVDKATQAPVAQIDRKLLNARDLMFGQQTYALIVAPGVDMALMVAMVVALDEKNNESSGGGAAA